MHSALQRGVSDRIRFLAPVTGGLLLLGWLAWFFPFDDLLDRQGTPLGADFTMFYVAGRLAADGSQGLYDQAAHQAELHRVFPGLAANFCLPYRYPPVVAGVMRLFSALPYFFAWLLFTSLSLAAYVAAIRMTWNANPGHPWPREARAAAVWFAMGWPVALEVLIGGQASMFALVIAAGAMACLQRQQYVATGVILALATYKPNVLLFFAIGLVLREPRILRGAIPVGAVLLAANAWAGIDTLEAYLTIGSSLATSGGWQVETPFWKAHHLAPAFDLLVPGEGRRISLVVGGVLTVALARWWRMREASHPQARSLALAGLLVVNAIFNPYTPIYDLVLLGLVATLLVQYGLAQPRGAIGIRSVQLGLLLLFLGPHLSQSAAKGLGWQLFPWLLAIAAAGFAWGVWRGRAVSVGRGEGSFPGSGGQGRIIVAATPT